MAQMRNFEAEALAAVRRGEHRIEGLLHHAAAAGAAPEQPATGSATMTVATAAAPQQEETMSIAQLEDDVKTDLTQGLDWLEGFVGRVKAAAPGIIATSEAVGGQTVGKLVEIAAGKFLPPGVEEEFLAIAGRYFGSFGQVPAAPGGTPAQ